MKPIHVLCGIDGLDDLLRIDLLWEGQLHKDAVDRGIGVEPGDKRQHLGLADGGRKPVFERAHPGLDRLARLVPHIDLACGILPHQNDSETRHDAAALQCGHCSGDTSAKTRRIGFSVDDRGAHGPGPISASINSGAATA